MEVQKEDHNEGKTRMVVDDESDREKQNEPEQTKNFWVTKGIIETL